MSLLRAGAAASVLAAVTGWAAVASAQPSECYFDKERMVDAQPMTTLKSTKETTGNMHYLLHLPEGHDKAKKWPVIVFMHGSGEIDPEGDDLNKLTKHSIPRVAEDPMFKYPFIVVSPQIDNAGWASHASEVAAVLDRMEAEFGGDPNREYLTGLSYGGVGTLSVGMALADRVAALMPVTPGGGGLTWDDRAKIVNLPMWMFIGTVDNEYATNQQRIADLEGSGAEAFFKYTYAFADEYKDAAPKEALTHKHVLGSYTDIGHDVWHATYGVYCPTLDSQKTVQYDWLLQQSKDGSPWVDPRDPNAGVGGSGGTAAGGAAGMPATGGAPSAGADAGGAPSMAPGGTPGLAGTAPSNGAGSGSFTPPASAASSGDSGGCSVASRPPRSPAIGALVLAGLALMLRARRTPRRIS